MRFASSAGNSPTSRKLSTCRSGSTGRWTGAFGLMSATATKPSASSRCSPSATNVQKRHSGCDTDDPLLGDGASTHPDQLPDRPVDEPRRVVVSVAAAGPVDEDD